MNNRKKQVIHDSDIESIKDDREQTKKRKISEHLSDFYEITWEGHVPIQSPKSVPEFERKNDYPFGTTRSGSSQGIKIVGKRCRLLPYKFFKPASLRHEELSSKHEENTIYEFSSSLKNMTK